MPHLTFEQQQEALRAQVPQGTAGARELERQGFTDVRFKRDILDPNDPFYTDPNTIIRTTGNIGITRSGQEVNLPRPVETFRLETGSITGDPDYDALLSSLTDYLNDLKRRGMVINPNIDLVNTPEIIARFTKEAEEFVSPFFREQLAVARSNFLRDAGFTTEQALNFERNLETQFGRATRRLGEEAADIGFTQSGIRMRAERELAEDTQRRIDEARRQLEFTGGTAGRQFAQQFGGREFAGLQFPTIAEAPRVLPGQETFARTGRELPFFQLSDDVFSRLTGQQPQLERAQIETDIARRRREFLTEGELARTRRLTL